MKKLNNYILEKLIINKDSKLKHNVDSLNNDNIVLISDRWTGDEEPSHDDWEDAINELDDLDKNLTCGGYLIMRFVPLGKSKNLEKDIIDIDKYLEHSIYNIINGKDLGYEIRMVGGHIEVDCINSGSRGTYYIYALEPTAWDHLSAWWCGDEEINSLTFLFAENSIVPIEYK